MSTGSDFERLRGSGPPLTPCGPNEALDRAQLIISTAMDPRGTDLTEVFNTVPTLARRQPDETIRPIDRLIVSVELGRQMAALFFQFANRDLPRYPGHVFCDGIDNDGLHANMHVGFLRALGDGGLRFSRLSPYHLSQYVDPLQTPDTDVIKLGRLRSADLMATRHRKKPEDRTPLVELDGKWVDPNIHTIVYWGRRRGLFRHLIGSQFDRSSKL